MRFLSLPSATSILLADSGSIPQKCYRQCNFQTLAQIVYGLQSPEVERLKKTWARVSTWEMRQFRSMREFVSHLRNVSFSLPKSLQLLRLTNLPLLKFKLLREATAACIAEYGPPLPRGSISMPPDSLRASLGAGVKPAASSGCIPFLGKRLNQPLCPVNFPADQRLFLQDFGCEIWR